MHALINESVMTDLIQKVTVWANERKISAANKDTVQTLSNKVDQLDKVLAKIDPLKRGEEYEQLIEYVQNWAMNRGLNYSDPHAQALKIGEELGELYQAFLKEHEADELDAIGDLQVTLIVYCLQRGIDYKECLADAYKVIENREGKTKNGVFIKEADM